MKTTQERSSSILNICESIALRVAACIGSAALLTGCASNSSETTSPAEQPAASQSASEAPTPVETIAPVEKIDTPEVDHSDTGISSIAEATAILDTVPPIDMDGASADFQALIDAANGDTSSFDELRITINDVATNYELTRIYIETLKPNLVALEAEQSTWYINHTDGYGIISTYDDTRATKYLLGKVLEQYQSGDIALSADAIACPEPDNNTVQLANGISSTTVAPPLSPFRFTYIAEECQNLGEITEAVLSSGIKGIGNIGARLASKSGLTATANAFTLYSDIANLTNSEAAQAADTYKFQ